MRNDRQRQQRDRQNANSRESAALNELPSEADFGKPYQRHRNGRDEPEHKHIERKPQAEEIARFAHIGSQDVSDHVLVDDHAVGVPEVSGAGCQDEQGRGDDLQRAPAGNEQHHAGVDEHQQQEEREDEQRVADAGRLHHREGLMPEAPVVQRDQDDSDDDREDDVRAARNLGWNGFHTLSRSENWTSQLSPPRHR